MIEIIKADICSLEVEAIVNAANESLLGGGGVDGAIHRAAGPRLLEFNRSLEGCHTGETTLSPGFDLRAKWVISTVGPIWQDGLQGEHELLASCYHNSFLLALENNVESLAFPAISTGVYGFPKPQAAKIALSVMKQYEESLRQIVVCCFSTDDLKLYQQVQTDLFS